jgi:hypothetical protein
MSQKRKVERLERVVLKKAEATETEARAQQVVTRLWGTDKTFDGFRIRCRPGSVAVQVIDHEEPWRDGHELLRESGLLSDEDIEALEDSETIRVVSRHFKTQ